MTYLDRTFTNCFDVFSFVFLKFFEKAFIFVFIYFLIKENKMISEKIS